MWAYLVMIHWVMLEIHFQAKKARVQATWFYWFYWFMGGGGDQIEIRLTQPSSYAWLEAGAEFGKNETQPQFVLNIKGYLNVFEYWWTSSKK